MISAVCQHERRTGKGKTKAGTARYVCKDCGRSFTDSTRMFDGIRIGLDRAVQIIDLLCEGMSVSAVARHTDTDPHTVIGLLQYVGQQCDEYMREHIRDVFVSEVQMDETWGYVYCKARTAKRDRIVGGVGDFYTFTAIERQTKLLVAWHTGRRDRESTFAFCAKLNRATIGPFKLSSDNWKSYPDAVKWNLGRRVTYGTITKIFGKSSQEDQRRYSPPRIIGVRKRRIIGEPKREEITTSHCERLNASIRTFVKRMARLTLCFSKRVESHRAAMALFFCHYNYCRKHRTLKGMTPAMAHGLTTEVWTVRQMLQNVCPT